MRRIVVGFLLLSLNSCGENATDEETPTEKESGSEYTTASEPGSSSNDAGINLVDTATGGDSDTDTAASIDYGIWHDETSGLDWMKSPYETGLLWNEAISYCDAFSQNGYDDWRLPTIDELRTLVRGCPPTEPTGECPVVEGVGSSAIETTDVCSGCEKGQGGASDGCYWDPALLGPCTYYWASSPDTDFMGSYAWNLLFYKASITSTSTDSIIYQVRCVRGPGK